MIDTGWLPLETYSLTGLLAHLEAVRQWIEREPSMIAKQALMLRIYDVEQEIACWNAAEVARRDAAGLPVPGAGHEHD